MAKYKKKQYLVEAIQLANPMTLTVDAVTTTGAVGDWLVTDEQKVQFFLTNTEFLKAYELVQP